jgi:methylmalonyl-CoA mutase N-terminal domain/subunit
VVAPLEEAGKLFNDEALTDIQIKQDEWETSVLRESLKQKPEAKSEFRSGSGDIVVDRIYTPAHIANFSYEMDLGFPGQYPYTRGIHPSGNRAHVEPLVYYSGFGSSEDANKRYRELIAKGGTTIALALDLPTQIGYDSDHPLTEGEVGKVGVAVDSLEDMERLFDGIPLDKISTGTVGNCISTVALSLFYALGEKRGVPPQEMRVSLQNDLFKEYTGRGTYIFPPRIALSLAADVVEFCSRYLPQWVPQYVCVTQMRWGGCSAAQEIAFGIANFITYLDAALERGVKLEELVPKMHFHCTTDNDLFEEVAKFRAIRRIWAKIVGDRYGTKDPRVLGIKITNWTGSHRLTAQQPLNNIVRTTLHTLACMLGGVEEIMNPAFDEALALPTVESTRLAAVTKHIIHYEAGIANTVDPLGGSYYVESLTNQIEKQARQCFQEIMAKGGALAAIENGYYLKEMADGMYKYQIEVDAGERAVIGVNKDELAEEPPIKIFTGNPEAEKRQIDRLRSLKERRNNALVKEMLEKLRIAAEEKVVRSSANIVPSVLDAVRAYCTIGEICGIMRSVFGEYKPSTYF